MAKQTRDVTYTIQITDYYLSLYPGITLYPPATNPKRLRLARLTLNGDPINDSPPAVFYINFYPDGLQLNPTPPPSGTKTASITMEMNYSQLPAVLNLLRNNPNCGASYSSVGNEVNGIVTLKTKRR